MRNVKTALAVFICLLIYKLLGISGDFLACTSAIICMQGSVEQSFTSGLNRLQGTALGAAVGMVFLYINLFFHQIDLMLVFAPVGVVVIIMCCSAIRKRDSIVIACVVFLVILLQRSDLNPFLYSLKRLVDTAVGIGVSLGVNRFVVPPAPKAKKRK